MGVVWWVAARGQHQEDVWRMWMEAWRTTARSNCSTVHRRQGALPLGPGDNQNIESHVVSYMKALTES